MACRSASLAFAEAIWIPCCARESVSLIALVLDAVSSSSSFTRSRIGSVWRATYFLRANGFMCPQKPSRLAGCKGSLPVAESAFVPLWLLVDIEVWEAELGEVAVWELELLSCAKTGTARITLNNRPRRVRFFILDFLH